MHTMTPSSSHNLTTFLKAYDSFGEYFLTHAVAGTGVSAPEFIWDDKLTKRKLHVREAWEIERHDLDSAGIFADDDPIIPKGQEKAPIIDLLRWKRENESRMALKSRPLTNLGRQSGLGKSRVETNLARAVLEKNLNAVAEGEYRQRK